MCIKKNWKNRERISKAVTLQLMENRAGKQGECARIFATYFKISL